MSGNINRRQLLAVGATVLLGGCIDKIPNPLEEKTPDQIEQVISIERGAYKLLEFYQNGLVVIKLSNDVAGRRVAFGHRSDRLKKRTTKDPEDAIKIYSFDKYSSNITVNMKKAIRRYDQYPSNEFKLRLIEDKGEITFSAHEPEPVVFTVPESYLP